MLKLSRLIVKIQNAFRRKPKAEETEATDIKAELKEIDVQLKAECKSHDFCEECDRFNGKCVLADDPRGIPCYWEVDE